MLGAQLIFKVPNIWYKFVINIWHYLVPVSILQDSLVF